MQPIKKEIDIFFKAAGIWKDRKDINMEELRNKVWNEINRKNFKSQPSDN